MTMYESPIKLIMQNTKTQIEDEVFKAVTNIGIDVDKGELIRALSYDREQYTKGYQDALAYIQRLERERDALLDTLKKADVYGECANCRHRDSAPSDCGGDCILCGCKCFCWHCVNGDKWEWVGVKEDE